MHPEDSQGGASSCIITRRIISLLSFGPCSQLPVVTSCGNGDLVWLEVLLLRSQVATTVFQFRLDGQRNPRASFGP